MEWWHQLLIGVAGTIIVGIIVGLLFYWLQLRHLRSAAVERLSRAKEELVDIVELHVINEQEISGDTISRLIRASSRDHDVQLEGVYSLINLIEDVELRLQRSRHLDSDEKEDYAKRIKVLVEDIQAAEKPTPVWQRQELDQLKAAITNGEKANALSIIERLSKRPFVPEANLELIRRWEYRQAQYRTAVGLGMAMIIASVVAVIIQLVT